MISIPVNLSGMALLGEKPCKMRCDIRADIVSATIPLLISRQSLKALNSTINFILDELTIGCEMIAPLKLAENGHLFPPLGRANPEQKTDACPTCVPTEPSVMPECENPPMKGTM